MNPQSTWILRNLSLRLLGLPPLEDRQHEYMEAHLGAMATLMDDFIKQAEARRSLGITRSEALGDQATRRLVAMLAELGWRIPAVCNDVAAEQAGMIRDLHLIDRDLVAQVQSSRLRQA